MIRNMSMKAQAIRNFNTNNMYSDKLSIFRYEDVKNPDSSTTKKLKEVPELFSIPCLLTIEQADNAAPGPGANSLNANYTIFTSDLNIIKAGDYIRVLSKRKEYKFISGDPVIYDFHQEVPVSLGEWA